MNKKKTIILCATIGVVVCIGLLVFVLTKDNSITTNTNEETENHTINNSIDNVIDNTINDEINGEINDTTVSTEQNTTTPEESTGDNRIEQPTSDTNNQNISVNTNTNTGTNTNTHSVPTENENNTSQDSQGSTSTEIQNPTTPSNPEVEPEVNVTNYGDVNADGTINAKDLIFIKEYINGKRKFSESQLLVADVNADGVVDDVDTDVLAKYIAGGYNIELPYNSGKKYNITYELNGGVVSNNKTLRSAYASISEIEALPTLVKDEYVFIGWTGSNGNTPKLTVTPKSYVGQNLHYIANWKLYGDVNEDGTINAKDCIFIREYVSGKREFSESQLLVADVNADGVVNDVDIDILTKFIAGGYGIDKLPYKS